jgi:hypothetical protein
MDRITSKARLILSLDDSSFRLLIDTEGGGRPTVKDTLVAQLSNGTDRALRPTCSKSGHFHQPEVHKTRNSKPHRRTVTVTATDYEFQRAALLPGCRLVSVT